MTNFPNLNGMDLGPLPYESMESVGARLAWRNGKPLRQLAEAALKRAVNNQWDGRGIRPTAVGILASQCGWGEESAKARYLVGKSLEAGKRMALHAGFRFCPICLESAYHSYLFEWQIIQTCPIHGCLLSNRCQSCGKEIRWSNREDSISILGYRCIKCKYFLAGQEPSIADHLLLRDHKELINTRFKPYKIYALQVNENAYLAQKMSAALRRIGSSRLRPWCHIDSVQRVGLHIQNFMGGQAGAATYGGIVRIRWKKNSYSLRNSA